MKQSRDGMAVSPSGLSAKSHWDGIYEFKADRETSWFEPTPEVSLALIEQAVGDRRDVGIIDVGAGTSRLVDNLLDRGFRHLGVLDVSRRALDRTSERLGPDGARVRFIEADALSLDHVEGYDLWHDRAMFHFLEDEGDIDHYVSTMSSSIAPGGHAILATFGPEGPTMCSGLPVQRYDETALAELLGPAFSLKATAITLHSKPNGGAQQFLYCLFERAGAQR